MFDKFVAFLKSVLHVILPNPDWKKLVAAGVIGVASFFMLGYVLPALLDIKIVALVGACVVGYLFYTKVAMWEIERAWNAAKDLASKVGVKV